jgi:hypothetical protein
MLLWLLRCTQGGRWLKQWEGPATDRHGTGRATIRHRGVGRQTVSVSARGARICYLRHVGSSVRGSSAAQAYIGAANILFAQPYRARCRASGLRRGRCRHRADWCDGRAAAWRRRRGQARPSELAKSPCLIWQVNSAPLRTRSASAR